LSAPTTRAEQVDARRRRDGVPPRRLVATPARP